ncbi:MAG: hypothetical protein CMB80_28585 [Flammeovirgaceae bacterium]|nr:hypothetical protein [Flammeovirgaceae bacterium]
MEIYSYNPQDITRIIENFQEITHIILKITKILQSKQTDKEKIEQLQQIKCLDKEAIDLLLENQSHYESLAEIFEKFKKHKSTTQTGGGLIPDKVLFPLHAVEQNIPISGFLMDWMLFLSTIISVFTKIASPIVKAMMEFGSDIFWTVLGAIPLFGFDPLVSALSVPMKYGFNIFIDFVVGLINATPNLYKFVIQLSRKNFGDAVKEFSKTTKLFTQFYNLLSKALPLLNNNLIFLTEYLPSIIKYAEPFAAIFLKTISGLNHFVYNFINPNPDPKPQSSH